MRVLCDRQHAERGRHICRCLCFDPPVLDILGLTIAKGSMSDCDCRFSRYTGSGLILDIRQRRLRLAGPLSPRIFSLRIGAGQCRRRACGSLFAAALVEGRRNRLIDAALFWVIATVAATFVIPLS